MVSPKREKMACQRSITQKKGRERGSHVSKKKKKKGMFQEREPMP
jgi:hypothetical protein